MRIRTFASLIPAALLFAACGSPSTGDTETESGTGTEAGSTSSSTSGGSVDPTTGNSSGQDCVPGQMTACTCNNGLDGAQTCNAQGTGYDPCVCTGTETSVDPSTTNMTVDSSTGPGTAESTTADPSTTDNSGTSTSGAESTTNMDGSTSNVDGTSTSGGDQPYGPCPNGSNDECLPNEICITGNNMMLGEWSICTPGECQGDNDCDVTPDDLCSDAPGDGMPIDYCLPQECNQNTPCPDGMMCYPGFGMDQVPVCLWPVG